MVFLTLKFLLLTIIMLRYIRNKENLQRYIQKM